MKKILAFSISLFYSVGVFADGEGASKALGTATQAASTAMMVNMMMAKKEGSLCSGSQVYMCVFMGLSLAQVVVDATAHSSSSTAANKFSDGNFCASGYCPTDPGLDPGTDPWPTPGPGSPGGPGGPDYTGGPGGPGGPNDPNIDPNNLGGDGGSGGGGTTKGTFTNYTKTALDKLADLKKMGYDVNPTTGEVTTAKGKFPASTFASGASMAAAGFIPKDLIGQADADIKKLQDQYKSVAMGISGGGGGGGGSGGGGTKFVYDDPGFKAFNPGGAGADGTLNGARTHGLTRTLSSGESIGAQIDNIFQMVSRRYQAKAAERIFVGQQPGE